MSWQRAAGVFMALVVACGGTSTRPDVEEPVEPARVDATNERESSDPRATRSGTEADQKPTGKPACLADELEPVPTEPMAHPHRSCSEGPVERCERSCEEGNADSCVRLGNRLEKGGQSSARARELYVYGCRLGSMNACTNYGASLAISDRDAADLACAARIFDETCSAGEPFGCGMYAFALARGWGMPSDPERAMAFAQRTCQEVGHFACSVLGSFHERGLTGSPDPDAAREAYQRACDTDEPSGCRDAERLRP